MARLTCGSVVAALLLSGSALAAPENVRRAVNPVVASTTNYGSLVEPGMTRDSCTSTLWTTNTVLWVCRDTQPVSNNVATLPVIPNTASFSGLPTARTNPRPLTLTSPPFGSLFYPLEADECPVNGQCSDGTRWVGWPDTAPAVTFIGSSGTNAYAFLRKQHLSGLAMVNKPSTTLYHVISQGSGSSALPSANVAVSGFWSSTQVGYGVAGSVVRNGFAYLYGPTPNGKLALARAAQTGFLGSLEDKSLYEYYVNGAWTRTAPASTDSTIPLPNTSSVQGQFYWSNKWQAYVWIGGDGFPNANFLISTAPNPEGPWTAAKTFFSGPVGTGALPAYSAVAHPSLTDGTGNYIFLTYTKTSLDRNGNTLYEQPLFRVDWQ
ncbi:hypothetical protein B0H15DRAFT_776922 [Mycena belliarum]|uniref:DUF4185 domain-containing protein n=1 Tax=Mycena belliarum TaxID=1033014 RepID=A0AAD6UC76_9AGAR|nr:hypothetical protein B0H15DRAFT_776922 [Mycena belliae]